MSGSSVKHGTAAGAGHSSNRRLIVAADDQPELLSLLRLILESENYNFLGVTSGPACVDLLFKVAPRLILLDVEMPGMTGFETCRRLRTNHAVQSVPIVFLTGRKSFEDLTDGLASGGNDFILKPLRKAMLLDRVHHWTSKRIGN